MNEKLNMGSGMISKKNVNTFLRDNNTSSTELPLETSLINLMKRKMDWKQFFLWFKKYQGSIPFRQSSNPGYS